ncbi:hypothetical protein B0H16DRAFT_1449812 [Mycena metata]|uniref:Uncharacterized protein n=1 Tax=Mycena metata TaxID=1033252 RepID=A0AAD7K615_9AGAR|nr:hypothetical protein B0H16DRAFT_1449812 [Mycena metata]
MKVLVEELALLPTNGIDAELAVHGDVVRDPNEAPLPTNGIDAELAVHGDVVRDPNEAPLRTNLGDAELAVHRGVALDGKEVLYQGLRSAADLHTKRTTCGTQSRGNSHFKEGTRGKMLQKMGLRGRCEVHDPITARKVCRTIGGGVSKGGGKEGTYTHLAWENGYTRDVHGAQYKGESDVCTVVVHGECGGGCEASAHTQETVQDEVAGTVQGVVARTCDAAICERPCEAAAVTKRTWVMPSTRQWWCMADMGVRRECW